jgi:hypothetical protein
MKALISPNENNRICQIEKDADVFQVAEPLHWVDCPQDIDTTWTYNNGQFVPPAPVEAAPVIEQTDPVDKLKAFLAANPDVAAILSN